MKYAYSMLIRQFAHMNNETERHNQSKNGKNGKNKVKRSAALLCITNVIYSVIIAYFISNAHYMQLERE